MSFCTYVVLGQTGFASQIANLLIKVVLAFAVVVQRMEMGLKGSSLSSEQQNLQSNTSSTHLNLETMSHVEKGLDTMHYIDIFSSGTPDGWVRKFHTFSPFNGAVTQVLHV
jgi:hypothetical protein